MKKRKELRIILVVMLLLVAILSYLFIFNGYNKIILILDILSVIAYIIVLVLTIIQNYNNSISYKLDLLEEEREVRLNTSAYEEFDDTIMTLYMQACFDGSENLKYLASYVEDEGITLKVIHNDEETNTAEMEVIPIDDYIAFFECFEIV